MPYRMSMFAESFNRMIEDSVHARQALLFDNPLQTLQFCITDASHLISQKTDGRYFLRLTAGEQLDKRLRIQRVELMENAEEDDTKVVGPIAYLGVGAEWPIISPAAPGESFGNNPEIVGYQDHRILQHAIVGYFANPTSEIISLLSEAWHTKIQQGEVEVPTTKGEPDEEAQFDAGHEGREAGEKAG